MRNQINSRVHNYNNTSVEILRYIMEALYDLSEKIRLVILIFCSYLKAFGKKIRVAIDFFYLPASQRQMKI